MRADSGELTRLRERVATLEAENALLRQKIDALVRRVFGATSEAIDPAQLELLLQLPAPAPAPQVEPSKPSAELSTPRPRREQAPRLPDDLPVVEQVLDPEPVQASPTNGAALARK